MSFDAASAAGDAANEGLEPGVPQPNPVAVAAESAAQLRLLRDVLGCPDGIPPSEVNDWLGWHGGLVPKLARSIYDDRVWDQLPILGDALEDADCTHEDMLAHCRGPGPHTRGCWVVDLVLGKG
ncbi:MAG: hypothetical protein LC749_13975 [Actinobacteria bacterium]|nr:hypothetical protein [Actinomycetota bacterium]